MRDKFYGDNRDIVKWGVLLELADRFCCGEILQVLYYRQDYRQETISVDGEKVPLPLKVIEHFRDVRAIKRMESRVPIKLIYDEFRDRTDYLRIIQEAITNKTKSPIILFLDPDIGLEPQSLEKGNHHICRAEPTHVCEIEVREIWKKLNKGDVLVCYQHQDNRANREWINRKKDQLAKALGFDEENRKRVKIAYAPEIAKDVAFYYIQKD